MVRAELKSAVQKREAWNWLSAEDQKLIWGHKERFGLTRVIIETDREIYDSHRYIIATSKTKSAL